MHCELCEICASKDERFFDMERNMKLPCSEREHGCPGFKPGNIPKVVE